MLKKSCLAISEIGVEEFIKLDVGVAVAYYLLSATLVSDMT
jgi:hypothetical protein